LVTQINNDALACQEFLFLDYAAQSIINLEDELQGQKDIVQTQLDRFLAWKSVTPVHNDIRKRQQRFATTKKPYYVPFPKSSRQPITVSSYASTIQ
jgi:hypothetical protein